MYGFKIWMGISSFSYFVGQGRFFDDFCFQYLGEPLLLVVHRLPFFHPPDEIIPRY